MGCCKSSHRLKAESKIHRKIFYFSQVVTKFVSVVSARFFLLCVRLVVQSVDKTSSVASSDNIERVDIIYFYVLGDEESTARKNISLDNYGKNAQENLPGV